MPTGVLWKKTAQYKAATFALSFWIEGFSRIHMGLNSELPEDVPVYCMIRILSYGLILLAILEKNRPDAGP